MKYSASILLIAFLSFSFGQKHNNYITIEAVEILNDNTEEAHYYFQNNWKTLRVKAVEKGYIESYTILDVAYTEETPFHLMLITHYKTKSQYDFREERFSELIKVNGPLKLLNDKKPGDFRKSIFSIDPAKHLD